MWIHILGVVCCFWEISFFGGVKLLLLFTDHSWRCANMFWNKANITVITHHTLIASVERLKVWLKSATHKRVTFCSSRWICFYCTYFHLVCEPPSGPDLAPCLGLRRTWEGYKQWNYFHDHEGKHNIQCIAIFQMFWPLVKASLFPAKCNKTMEPKCSVLLSNLGVQGHLWSVG